MAVILVKNTFGLDNTAAPPVVGETIAKAFNVAADKFTAYGPLADVVDGKFVNGKVPPAFLIETDDETANTMKKQRPNDVNFMGPCGPA